MPGFVIPTDRNGQLWIHFAPHDKDRYISAVDVLEGRVPPDRVAQRLVLIGTSAVGLLDFKNDAGRSSDAGGRSPRAGPRKHPDKFRFVLAELCDRRRAMRRASSRHCHHLAGADPEPAAAAAGRRNDRRDIDGRLVVLLRAEQAAVRFHLSAAVERPRLSDAGLQQLHQRGSAAPPHPLGFRPVSFARRWSSSSRSRPTSSCLAAKTAK